jgi:type IV secretory pathway TraG/TraD family ATPase VirD4
MPSIKSAKNSREVISRLLAAFIAGFILVNTLGITIVLLLPFERSATISWVTVLGFAFYSTLIMWVFHTPSQKKVWLVLALGIVLSSSFVAVMTYIGQSA